MHDPSPSTPAAYPTDSLRPLTLDDRWAASASDPFERKRLIQHPRQELHRLGYAGTAARLRVAAAV